MVIMEVMAMTTATERSYMFHEIIGLTRLTLEEVTAR